jgi:hypothetical protein
MRLPAVQAEHHCDVGMIAFDLVGTSKQTEMKSEVISSFKLAILV